MSRKIAEFAYDLHAGEASTLIPEFDDLTIIGMASTLAIHIKGLPQIEYDVLRMVSDHYMSIPSHALEKVLNVLAEVEFVSLITTGKKINTIIPKIPRFDDVYEGIGHYAKNDCALNEHEQATLQILGSLYDSPRSVDSLKHKLGIDNKLFDRVLEFSSKTGVTTSHMARGKNIIVSPLYFADNIDQVADAAAAAGANELTNVLNKVKDNQGWPSSLINIRGEIGGSKLSPTELSLIQKLSREGVIKPPSIKFGDKTESFLFTPRPGGTRLNSANREIYERAMALISAVRKGQLLADEYRIRYPYAILRSLRDNGYLKSNSEANTQYANLVLLRVATLKEVSPGRWQLHLIRTEENEQAIKLAMDILSTGQMADMEVNQEAKIALSKDEKYIQSIIASAELRSKNKQIISEEANHTFEQLLLKFD